MKMKTLFLVFGILFLCQNIIIAQNSNLYIPRDINQAYTNNTRSFDGKPGMERYLEVRLRVDPEYPVHKVDPTTPADVEFGGNYNQQDIFIGYGGCWVYLIGKKLQFLLLTQEILILHRISIMIT